MENSNLLALAAALSLLGLLLLAYAAHSASPQKLRISEISSAHVRKFVTTEGEISSIYPRNGNYFITLCSGECIRAVIFKRDVSALSTHETNIQLLKKGDRISVRGKVEEYNGQLEIIPSPPGGILLLR